MSIFKPCDIRGVVGEEWDTPEARRIGEALGRLLARRGERRIFVGGDYRRSTPRLKAALIDALRSTGIAVRDLGQVPTPLVYFAALQQGCPNVAIVTASHNPAQYNGVKVMVAGQPGVPELLKELEEEFEQLGGSVRTEPVADCQSLNVVPEYERWILKAAREFVTEGLTCTGKIPSGRGRVSEATGSDGPPSVVGPGSAAGDNARRARLQVSLDSMAGAFTEIAPRVLRSAGYAVASLVDRIDPDFTRGAPNPANDRNLALLAKHVRDHASAVGVALDGDGDRVIFVDGRGRIARPEQIAVLFIRHLFSQPLVVYDLKCASIVGQAARDAGGRALMQPSGHGFIKSTIIQQDADLGVEVSGHHFYGSLGGGDDGLFTALVLLELIVRTGKSLAHLLDEVPWPCITPDVRVPFRGESQALLEQIATACGGRVSRLDGVRAEYDEGWALARMSITEPAITFRFEGHDKIALRAIVERFLKSVPELKEAVLERIEQTGSL